MKTIKETVLDKYILQLEELKRRLVYGENLVEEMKEEIKLLENLINNQ